MTHIDNKEKAKVYLGGGASGLYFVYQGYVKVNKQTADKVHKFPAFQKKEKLWGIADL